MPESVSKEGVAGHRSLCEWPVLLVAFPDPKQDQGGLVGESARSKMLRREAVKLIDTTVAADGQPSSSLFVPNPPACFRR